MRREMEKRLFRNDMKFNMKGGMRTAQEEYRVKHGNLIHWSGNIISSLFHIKNFSLFPSLSPKPVSYYISPSV